MIEPGRIAGRKGPGRGYATEAAACRDYALGLQRLIALIMPHNTPSRRVAERLGMAVENGIVRPVGGLHLVYVLSRQTRGG